MLNIKSDTLFDRFRYFIGLKSGITYIDSFIYSKIKIDLDDDLPLKKILTLHNAVTIRVSF